MNEHDDDLDSTVHEDAAQETDAFPDTGEELDDIANELSEEDEESDLDDDESEL